MKRLPKNSALINLARGVGRTAGRIAATAHELATGAAAVLHTEAAALEVVKLPDSAKRISKARSNKPHSRSASKKARSGAAKVQSTAPARTRKGQPRQSRKGPSAR